MELEFSRDFKKYSNMKFHENPSSGSRVVPCGRTDRRADMTKLIVVFRNFANALKNVNTNHSCEVFKKIRPPRGEFCNADR